MMSFRRVSIGICARMMRALFFVVGFFGSFFFDLSSMPESLHFFQLFPPHGQKLQTIPLQLCTHNWAW